jgi:hypothetical protein
MKVSYLSGMMVSHDSSEYSEQELNREVVEGHQNNFLVTSAIWHHRLDGSE